MADRKLDYQIGVDASKGITGVKQFSSTVKKELKSIEDDFDDTATAGQKVATVLSKMASELDSELDRAAQAAEALSQALGPELAGKADVGSIVGDLQRMGLTFEDIVTDADKLAASLKQLDEVQVKGLESGLGGVDTKVGDIGRSASGSRSVLANMVGNTTQDLGALTGVAGSAGVAIGQMGEYIADAAGEGEKLSSVIGNFGKIAVPLAAIGFVTKGIADHFSEIAKTKAFNKEQVQGYLDALREGESLAESLLGTLQETGELKFDLEGFDVDVAPSLARLDIDLAQFQERSEQGSAAWVRWAEAAKAAGANADDVDRVMIAGIANARNLAGSHKALALETELAGDAQKGLKKSVEDLTDAEAAAVQQIIDIQRQHTDAVQAQKDAYKAAQKAAEEAYAEEVTRILGLNDALGDLAGTFEQMSIRQDALSSIFDLGNAPIDAAGRVRDIELAIDDLSVAAEELDLSEGLDPENLKADALLDQLDSLRPQIQQKITEAFSTGGEEAALAMAHDYIAKVAEELGISEIEAAELMGLEDVQVLLKVAVEHTAIENARRQLELLTGLTGESPWTASIALALDERTITGPQAQRQIQRKLRELGVVIPAELVPEVTPHGKRKGKEELDEVANPGGRGRPAKIEPGVDQEGKRKADDDLKKVTDPAKPRVAPIYAQAAGLQAAEIAIEQVARTRTADVYIVVHHPDGSTSGSTGGGTSGGGGGGFGPFSVGPTALAAPVPAITSGGGGYGAMTIPVAAPSQPVIINNVLNAAVVGDPYAVARAMEDGTRRAARLMPRNP